MSNALLTGVDPGVVRDLHNDRCRDPHAILGAHECTMQGTPGLVVRAYHPDAVSIELQLHSGELIPMQQVGDGLFACFLPGRSFPIDYQVAMSFEDGARFVRRDPYCFLPTLGDLDLHLAGEGRHLKLYEKMGAHLREINGVAGVSFSVWAPNAKRVSVVGDFNNWDGRLFPMRQIGSSGIWEIFVPGIGQGSLYKYEIKTSAGQLRLKSDPFAFAMELRPQTASAVYGLTDFAWADRAWMKLRRNRDLRRSPMAIYEIHLGSWMRLPQEDNRWLSYREMAERLVGHVKDHGFNFIELMPISEYVYDPSWGYQVTGYFAPTCRFGSPDDFRYLVDYCHQNGIGVILDWVPAHFPKDDFSLRQFDGTALYEHEDPRKGEHKDWGTLIFNYGRHEVRNFLLSNACYWLDQFHIDGLRVDAVASMIYLDYSRKAHEWEPNKYGGNENLEAIEFLREVNKEVYANFPGAFTLAEESTSFAGVTSPTHLGGLGFGFKWDMGWMNDTLSFFRKDPIHRKYHHNDLTFSMMYAYSENFVMPLSHDEVAQGKGSLYDKMPGDHWQKLANLRLLFTYLFTHPGKKLLFMGAEFGQGREWSFDKSLDWHEASELERAGLQQFFKELGRLYQRERALWARELEPEGFFWIDCSDSDSGCISYVRWGDGEELIVVLNLTPTIRHNYRIGAPRPGRYREILNSDAGLFGGSNVGNGGWVDSLPEAMHGHSQCLELTLPPLAGLIFKRE